jgi:hypothetical protein
MEIPTKLAFLIAITSTGMLCGASLDQSIKQLPARHKIGMKAFSSYAKAADLKNGIIWYASLGITSVLSSVIIAILVWQQQETKIFLISYMGVFFAICHMICTLFAAPTYFKQKKIGDEETLRTLFKKFEFISTTRSIFITLNFLCFIGALAVLA